MSHPIINIAVRRLSRPQATRATISAVSFPGPTASLSASASSRRTFALSSAPKRTLRIHDSLLQCSRAYLNPRQPRSNFSSSAANPAPQVTQNPKVDDDGNTLMIGISERAANRLRAITDPSSSPSATKEDNPYHHLRITVTSGGCHGFQYLMSLEPASKIDVEEDTIFQADAPEASEGRSATTSSGNAKVVMDEPSLELLSGSTVDYTTELIGSQFKIVDNPRATSSCGCGTSFDVTD